MSFYYQLTSSWENESTMTPLSISIATGWERFICFHLFSSLFLTTQQRLISPLLQMQKQRLNFVCIFFVFFSSYTPWEIRQKLISKNFFLSRVFTSFTEILKTPNNINKWVYEIGLANFCLHMSIILVTSWGKDRMGNREN